MGLTSQSTGLSALKEMFELNTKSPDDLVIALAGNPNTGKSTVFNSLTGLKQHTGNWPGKTVVNAQGTYYHRKRRFVLVDLPGTYSLFANSAEEEVARDFICFGNPHATVVVTDATCLERNLNLALQIMEITRRVVICVNLLDEAKRKNIKLRLDQLSELLGVPVVGTNARDGFGLVDLKDQILKVASMNPETIPLPLKYPDVVETAISAVQPVVAQMVDGKLNPRWTALRLIDSDSFTAALRKYLGSDIDRQQELMKKVQSAKEFLLANKFDNDKLRDTIVATIIQTAELVGSKVITQGNKQHSTLDRRIDSIITSRVWGIPIMLALLGAIFWLTIEGANYPSQVLALGLFYVEDRLTELFFQLGLPEWLHGVLVLGMYRTLAWVVSVMLPPMGIFFPLFTLLEDLGLLPRVAFNLDSFFKRAGAHGKQALTMCMGFGCNAAGVIACRIIDSPRERLIAIITNNFVPCNGRFPTLIALTIFLAGSSGAFQSVVATLIMLGLIILGILITLLISCLLSQSILKGLPSSFTLELPPYRKPQIGRILIRSLLDRTLFVLGRAATVAAPAGIVIWLMANIDIKGVSLLEQSANLLDPFAYLLGMDGVILMAFILGLPANEIVIPIIIMSYMQTGAMIELDNLQALRELLVNNGWTWLTAVCVMLFSLNHFPCGTTLLTIHKETKSLKWILISFFVPTATGIVICFAVAQTVRLFGLL